MRLCKNFPVLRAESPAAWRVEPDPFVKVLM